MPRTTSSFSDDDTLYYSETESEIANMAIEKSDVIYADDNLDMFKEHVDNFEKEYREQLSDYDDWAPDENFIPARKLKGTRLVDADIDLWRMRKTEHHARFTTAPKKRARGRSFKDKRVAFLSQGTQSDSECHADSESDEPPSTRRLTAETEERELVSMVQSMKDVHLECDSNGSEDFLAPDKILSPSQSQFSNTRISSSKLQQYRKNSTTGQLF